MLSDRLLCVPEVLVYTAKPIQATIFKKAMV